ncbi:cyclic nucleotide-binding domain-containing protein [Algoriphagus litoralis]|uniref:hypothetical protein n=1 Tax=Algoriphagus litoralis TaxID=2202829 RepID=UPI000DB9846C|nr:hypothetical protein [Algoriphagus litoralis]
MCRFNQSEASGNSKIKAQQKSKVIIVPILILDLWIPKYKVRYSFEKDTHQVRFEELLKVVDGIAFHRMDERVIEYLEKNAAVSHIAIVHKTHLQIAQELNSSREVITQMLKKLEHQIDRLSQRKRRQQFYFSLLKIEFVLDSQRSSC